MSAENIQPPIEPEAERTALLRAAYHGLAGAIVGARQRHAENVAYEQAHFEMFRDRVGEVALARIIGTPPVPEPGPFQFMQPNYIAGRYEPVTVRVGKGGAPAYKYFGKTSDFTGNADRAPISHDWNPRTGTYEEVIRPSEYEPTGPGRRVAPISRHERRFERQIERRIRRLQERTAEAKRLDSALGSEGGLYLSAPHWANHIRRVRGFHQANRAYRRGQISEQERFDRARTALTAREIGIKSAPQMALDDQIARDRLGTRIPLRETRVPLGSIENSIDQPLRTRIRGLRVNRSALKARELRESQQAHQEAREDILETRRQTIQRRREERRVRREARRAERRQPNNSP